MQEWWERIWLWGRVVSSTLHPLFHGGLWAWTKEGTVQTVLCGQGKARCNTGKEGSQVGRQRQEQPGRWLSRPAHPEVPFLRLLPFWRLLEELKIPNFPGPQTRPGAGPNVGQEWHPVDKLLFFVTLQDFTPDPFRPALYSPSPEFSFPNSPPFPAQVLPLQAPRCSGTGVISSP